MSRLDLKAFMQMKQRGEKITVLTAYDASFAQLFEQAGVEILLVGDSLGMVIQGHDSTRPVSLDDMVYHCRAVALTSQCCYIMADMPYHTYLQPTQTVENARRLVEQGGAQMVKLEGGREQLEVIEALVAAAIPVCGHLGLLPQSVTTPDGYKVQGRDAESAERILADAILLEQAGVSMLLLECVPAELAKRISQRVAVPVIGIGAGVDCDAQVLVSYDMLGISGGHKARFVHNFLRGNDSIEMAVQAYVQAVKDGRYPAAEHTYQ
ncbi:3-methyl-2-oxobutanoate hydroxymethyltransferase [Sulfuriflexus mobilis]|uniref:3-methyl-2-oxobutanoate hydroxymethyltransferase n=1 Tax=Sulfuriflexus mobilis TaxID=1811807 RepID=UPI000F84CC5A|nr:3-methyl-2-oxobutanoate hydroxymethyltransferase [Sulfuriflexus mobilis]